MVLTYATSMPSKPTTPRADPARGVVRCAARGLTLIELLVVLVILAALGGLVVPLVGDQADKARSDAARVTLRRVQEVIVGSPQTPGYFRDMRSLPRPNPSVYPDRADHPQMHFLFQNPDLADSAQRTFDPATSIGWRGPYLISQIGRYAVDVASGFTDDFGEDGDAAILDPWERPIVIDFDLDDQTWQLVSAGEDGQLGTSDDLHADLTSVGVAP